MTLNDVDFNGNTASDKITNQFSLTYSNTTGVVFLENDVPMPSPMYSSGFSTGAPTILGGYPSFTVTVGTGPSSTGKLILPKALTGWTAYLSRRDQSYNRPWIQHQDDGKHLYYRDSDRL